MENLFLIAKVKNFVREKQSSMRKLTTIITGVILLEIFSSNLWEIHYRWGDTLRNNKILFANNTNISEIAKYYLTLNHQGKSILHLFLLDFYFLQFTLLSFCPSSFSYLLSYSAIPSHLSKNNFLSV